VTDTHEVIGLFRDRNQARLAIAAARREGLYVVGSDLLTEDPDGVRVVVRTTGAAEDARVLLLTYEAYRAAISP
jgi:hypothetical protein